MKKLSKLLVALLGIVLCFSLISASTNDYTAIQNVENKLVNQTGSLYKADGIIPYDYFVFGKGYTDTSGGGGANLTATQVGFANTTNGRAAFANYYNAAGGNGGTFNFLSAAKGNMWRLYTDVGTMADGTHVDVKVTIVDGEAASAGPNFGGNKAAVGLNLYAQGTTTKQIGWSQLGVNWLKLKFEFFETGTTTPVNKVKLVTTLSDIDGNNGVTQGIEFAEGLVGLYYDTTCQLSVHTINGNTVIHDTTGTNQQADDYSTAAGKQFGFTPAINTGDTNYFELVSYFPTNTTGAFTALNPQLNNILAGGISVTKVVKSQGNVLTSDSNTFNFTLKYTLPNGVVMEEVPWEMNGEEQAVNIIPANNQFTFTLTAGQVKTFMLPEGTSYTITEAAHESFNTTKSGDTGTIVAAQNKKATFTNEYKNYKITLIAGNGIASVSGAGTYDINKTATIKATLKNGYKWVNWTGYATQTAQTYTTDGIKQDRTYTANATPIDYKINYDLKGGTATGNNPTSYNIETDAFTLSNPTRNGYNFAGWIGANGTTPQTTCTQPKGQTGDKTYTATWTPINYKINYVLNGGTNNSANPSQYNIETPTITLQNPTRNDYTFVKWAEGSSIPKGSTGNKTFTAEWKPTDYKIEYDLQGGTATGNNPASYNVETPAFTLSNPTRKGYEFTGWTGANGTNPNPNYTQPKGQSGNKKYTANWKPVTYKINYVLNGGTNNAANPGTYNIESPTINIQDPTRKNYEFNRWLEGNSVPTGSTGDKTFTAEWFPVEFPIDYELNGGRNHVDNPDVYNVESVVTIKDPTRKGYRFVKWKEGNSIPKGSTGAKLFTAEWAIAEYDVAYILGEGGVNHADNPDTYRYDDPEISIENPTRPGYTFVKWEEGDKIPSGSTGDKVFTAVWEGNADKLNYDSNGGEGKMDATDGKVGENVKVAENGFSRTNYVFNGWNTKKDGSGKSYNSTDDYTLTPDNPDTDILYAMWLPKPMTITYRDGIEEKLFADEKIISAYNNDFPKYTAPERPGYTFTGWDKEVPAKVTQDMVLTATWKANEYKIEYVLNGGTNHEDNPAAYTYEDSIAIQNPTKKGHDFIRWIEGNTIPAGSTGDKKFTAEWKAHEFTVTYTDGVRGTVFEDEKHTVEYENPAPAYSKKPEREGYKFDGWDKEAPAKVTEDIVITAKWSPEEYSIKYVLNGGTNDAANPDKYTVEDAISIKDPSKPGHSFIRWTEGNKIAKGSTGDKTFTAEWEAFKYNVIFKDGADGTVFEDEKHVVEYNSDAPEFTGKTEREGYTFKGWDKQLPEKIVEDIVLTATWEKDSYKINYILNGGTNHKDNPASYTVDDAIVIKAPVKEGYDFIRWTEGNSIPKGTTGDKTFTAEFKAKEFTVTYKDGLDGNLFDDEKHTVEYDTVTPGYTGKPERPGYTFKGWDKEIPETVKEDIVLTAVWEKDSYKVNYVLDGGTNDEKNPESYTVEDEYTILAPVKEGHTFVKWEEGNVIEKGSTGDKTFTAVWEINKYTVKYVDGLNGGVFEEEAYTAEYNSDTPKFQGELTREGFTFEGWSEEIADKVTKDVTYVANWKELPKYTITYKFNIEGVADEVRVYPEGYKEVIIDVPENPGYTFQHWQGSKYYPKDIYTVTEDHTFEAIWEPNKYVLSIYYYYEGNPEPFQIENIEVPYGSDYSVASPEIVNYRPDLKVVEGTMPNENVIVGVTYVFDPIPETGDASNLLLPLSLFAGANLTAVTAVVIYKKRREEDE